jgi:hypothetical protein
MIRCFEKWIDQIYVNFNISNFCCTIASTARQNTNLAATMHLSHVKLVAKRQYQFREIRANTHVKVPIKTRSKGAVTGVANSSKLF